MLIGIAALVAAALLPVAARRWPSKARKPAGPGESEPLTPDLCVIGGGAGGLAVATAAAALGVPVVLIERGRMGGDSLHAGCVPSKALLAAGKRAEALRTSAPFGVKAQRANVEFTGVNDHVLGVVAAVAPNAAKQRLTGLGVQVIEGDARFKDASTVTVGDREIRARRFVVATGSQPLVPPIPGLDQTPFLTSETVFEARERPKHLIVVGADPRGLELAQAFRRLGSDVTVLETAQTLLPDEDPECAAVVIDQLVREGVTIRSGVTIARVRRMRAKIEVVLAGEPEQTIEGSDLLIAGERRPTVDGLGLEAARIKHGPAGIVTDKKMRTSNKRVYAVGDVAGQDQIHPVQLHASGAPPRRPGDPACAVPPVGEARRRPRAAGDLHRSRTGTHRPDRGAGPHAPPACQGAALALPGERAGPGGARDARPYQGGDR